MGKNIIYYIVDRFNRNSIFSGDYNSCLKTFNSKDKSFRKSYKIIPDEEYQKIIKKKPVL